MSMITLSDDVIALAREKNAPLRIGVPYQVSGCCFDLTECPPIDFGVPRDLAAYRRQTIQDITVYIPRQFPDDRPLTVRIRRLFGFRQLVLDGWRAM